MLRGRLKETVETMNRVREDAHPHEADLELLASCQETEAKLFASIEANERGKYGRCKTCGAEVSEARLKALVFTDKCDSCADKVHHDVHRRELRGAKIVAQRKLPLFSLAG
jgi:RNA polymerase-binding transcription factor DksA